MARPRMKLDRALIQEAASIGCTTEEIARLARASWDTIDRRCKEEIENGRAQLRSSLRRRQYELAMNGNATMLIWLGKQLLGQRDDPKNLPAVNSGTTLTPDQEAAAMDSTVPAAPIVADTPPTPPAQEVVQHEPQPTPQGMYQQGTCQNDQQEINDGIPVLN